MTTSTKAASNGGTAPAPAAEPKPDRPTGMAQVRQALAYHTSSVMNDAAFEAYRLCDQIHRAVADAYLRDHTAAETAESPDITANVQEALDCLRTARRYLESLTSYEPPF
jgi:hypothetical protein